MMPRRYEALLQSLRCCPVEVERAETRYSCGANNEDAQYIARLALP